MILSAEEMKLRQLFVMLPDLSPIVPPLEGIPASFLIAREDL
jgi:hypothetical protein